MRVSIVIPAFDEEDNLRPLRSAIKEALEGRIDYEAIVVDDGSRDGTRAVARQLAAEDPRFRLVALDQKPDAARFGLGLDVAEAKPDDLLRLAEPRAQLRRTRHVLSE